MKTINKKKLTMIITIAVLVLFLAGFECTVDSCTISFNDFSGNAVNVKAASGTEFWKAETGTGTLQDAVISLYAYDSTTGSYSTTEYDTTTVSSTGTFTFLSPEPNRYKLTGQKTGWTFVPRYIEVTGSGATINDLLAYPTDASEYTIIASWQNNDIDVDLTLTYGPEGVATTNPWVTGDTDAFGERLRIFYNGAGDASGVKLDRDVEDDDLASVPRVETISIYSSAWFNDADTIKVYLDTPYNDQVLTGVEDPENTSYPAAYAQVDLMNGATHYGTWYIPWNTFESTLQIIEMDFNLATSELTSSSANNANTLYGGIKSIIWE